MTSNFTATVQHVQQIPNYSAFNEDVFNWFLTEEEHIFPVSKLAFYWLITNKCVLWKAIGINSIKTKDFTECKFEATKNDLTSSNKKGCFWFWLLWVFKSFLDVKSHILWVYSQVKWFWFFFVLYRQEWCINMAKACNVLSCLKLNFSFARHHNNFVSKNSLWCFPSFHERLHVHEISSCVVILWQLVLYYKTGLCSYVLPEDEVEKWMAGLWKW